MLHCRPESLLSRSRTVTAAAGVPLHWGIHFDALSLIFRSPSSCAMPTSTLVMDFVTENTSWVVSRFVPRKYHSSAILPYRRTMRQFDWPARACAAIRCSRAADRPTEPGDTVCQAGPVSAEGRLVAGGVPVAGLPPPLHPAARRAASRTATAPRVFIMSVIPLTSAPVRRYRNSVHGIRASPTAEGGRSGEQAALKTFEAPRPGVVAMAVALGGSGGSSYTGRVSTVLRLAVSGRFSTESAQERSHLRERRLHRHAQRRHVLAGLAEHHPAFDARQQPGGQHRGRRVRAQLPALAHPFQRA